MKFNLSKIMTKAWELFRKAEITFSEALHRAWQAAKMEPVNARRIQEAKDAAGITEETKVSPVGSVGSRQRATGTRLPWAGWKAAGYEVIHSSKALFGATLEWASKGDGAQYQARFFGASHVQRAA